MEEAKITRFWLIRQVAICAENCGRFARAAAGAQQWCQVYRTTAVTLVRCVREVPVGQSNLPPACVASAQPFPNNESLTPSL